MECYQSFVLGMIELITFLGSYVLSFISTIVSKKMDHAAQSQKHLMQLAGLREESTQAARTQVTDNWSKFTRRMLAFSVTAILVLLSVGLTHGTVFVEVSDTVRGFWPFVSDKEVTQFIPVNGGVILTEYRLILLSVFGLYFGNNHAK